VLQMVEFLSPRYHVMVANPPYMGGKGMNAKLGTFLKDNYPNSKSDLFAAFIERSFDFIIKRGFSAMVTMESWMFLSSFEKLRSIMLENTTIRSMVHMPYLGKGGTSMGINFGTTAFVSENIGIPNSSGNYCCVRYFEADDKGVPHQFPPRNDRLTTSTAANFRKIPGSPIAYWLSEKVLDAFEKFPSLYSSAPTKQGLATGDNGRFLRLWYEVSLAQIGFGCKSSQETKTLPQEWYPCNKGGD